MDRQKPTWQPRIVALLVAQFVALMVQSPATTFATPSTAPDQSTSPVVTTVESGEEAYIYTAELFQDDGLGQWFGQSVAIEGDLMVVGATVDDIYGRSGACGRGVAKVFHRVDALTWELVARLTYTDPIECWSEDVSWAVAIHGDWIAVGAPGEFVLLPEADPVEPEIEDYNVQGVVLMYHKPAGGWRDATETAVLTEFDGTRAGFFGDVNDSFGVDVAFEGDDLVVGAPNYDSQTMHSTGAVFVYREWLGTWERTAKLTSDSSGPVHFGGVVDASDGAIAVGNYDSHFRGPTVYGGAWVFERPVDGWADTDTPSATVDLGGIQYTGVALDGPTLVVDATLDSRAFVVERPPGGWVGTLEPSAELILPIGGQHTRARDVDGDLIVIGSGAADFGAGEAYVYRRPEDGWGVAGEGALVDATQTLQHPDADQANGGDSGDEFGRGVAIGDGYIAVGAQNREHQGSEGPVNLLAGSLNVFESTTDHEPPQTAFSLEPAEPTGSSGWYDEPLTVAIDATDVGSGVGQVRCALVTGGSFTSYDQLPAGPCPYTDGAAVPEGEWILFAASADADGNRSPVVSRIVKVDVTDPTPVIELDPSEPTGPDGAWLPPLYVKVDSLEDEMTRAGGWCTLDPPIAPTTYEELRAMPFCGNDFWSDTGREYTVDETHTLWVAAIDRAGNTSGVISRTYSVVRRPQISIGLASDAPANDGWYRSPVTVTVTGTAANGQPAAQVRCALDPAVVPITFDDMAAGCQFLTGAQVTADGEHAVYAASRDVGGTSVLGSVEFRLDNTPPDLTCEGTGPASFTIGEEVGTISATVSDDGSGPSVDTVEAQLESTDLDAAGAFTVALSATDVAGNEGSVDCAYMVGYGIAIVSPTPGQSFRSGTTVPLAFQLVDADGVPIPDAAAASFIGTKRAPCHISIYLDEAALRGCPTYAATTDRFSFAVKTPKGRSAIGIHDIAVEIRAPASQTVIGVERVAILLN